MWVFRAGLSDLGSAELIDMAVITVCEIPAAPRDLRGIPAHRRFTMANVNLYKLRIKSSTTSIQR